MVRDQGGRPDQSPCTLLVHLFRPETGSCARERCTAISASDTGLHQHMLLFVFFKTQVRAPCCKAWSHWGFKKGPFRLIAQQRTSRTGRKNVFTAGKTPCGALQARPQLDLMSSLLSAVGFTQSRVTCNRTVVYFRAYSSASDVKRLRFFEHKQ